MPWWPSWNSHSPSPHPTCNVSMPVFHLPFVPRFVLCKRGEWKRDVSKIVGARGQVCQPRGACFWRRLEPSLPAAETTAMQQQQNLKEQYRQQTCQQQSCQKEYCLQQQYQQNQRLSESFTATKNCLEGLKGQHIDVIPSPTLPIIIDQTLDDQGGFRDYPCEIEASTPTGKTGTISLDGYSGDHRTADNIDHLFAELMPEDFLEDIQEGEG